eukprot:gene23848-9404_t
MRRHEADNPGPPGTPRDANVSADLASTIPGPEKPLSNMAHLLRNAGLKPPCSPAIRRDCAAVRMPAVVSMRSEVVAPTKAVYAGLRTNMPVARRTVVVKAAEAEAAPKEEAPTVEVKSETFQYQAEVDRLMDMIVNSLYSNREVFLRELVSNASDALDKMRFLSVTSPELMKDREELEIKISCDKEKNIIVIEDSGVGMSKEQLLENLGTIARSGTRKFMEMMKEKKGDNNLIGQFGVGFYSSFLVADKVTVQTKSTEDDTQWHWSADAGSHQFSIKADEGEPLGRGSRITLHLKEDASELADPIKLAALIKQYSQFISFPIKLLSSKKEPIKVLDEEATAKKQEQADKKATEAAEESKPVEPVMKTDYEEKWDWRVENENKPIWTRSPKEVTTADYNEFFKLTFSEFLEPLAHVHFNVEGTIEFCALMYLPGMAPFDQQQNMNAKSSSIKLYVKRVFISDEFDEDLMPRYLSFIKGVVDSTDLPLNVSREILQESRIVRVIRKQLVKRSLEMITDLAAKEGGEDYNTFWENFGRNIKIGVIEDTENRDKLSKLLRFFSSKSEDGKMVSLEDYAGRVKDGQTSIYYMAADSVEGAETAPFVEKLVSKGYEVLYLTEAIDEATVTNMTKFGDFSMVDVSKEGLKLSDEEEEEDKKQTEEFSKEFSDVTAFLKKTLGESVEKVEVSSRLVDSPCAVVTSNFGWSANMERIMRTQAMGDARSMDYMKGRKIFEINPQHDIIRGIKTLLDENDTDRAADLGVLLYETALGTSGFQVDNPKDYASKVFTLMKIALGYDGAEPSAPAAPAAEPAAPSSEPSAPKLESVEAEVMDPNDPWNKSKQ